MTRKTLKLMARIESRLINLENKAQSHCGHDELVEDFRRSHDRFLKFIERELESLQKGKL